MTKANTPATPKPTKRTERAAWDMVLSILTGMGQAIEKAEVERDAALIAAGNRELDSRVSTLSQTIGILRSAKRDLQAEAHQLAKSSGLQSPG